MLRKLVNALVIAAFACLVFGFGYFVWSASQSPHLAPHYKSANQKERGPDKNTQTERERPEEAVARYTLWLTIFTGILAFATVGLGVATIGLYLAGKEQIGAAKGAAEAAKKSADALPAVERSYVFLYIRNFSFHLRSIDQPGMRRPSSSLHVWYNFVNYGKTPAVVREIRVGVRRSADPLPPDAWAEQERKWLFRNVLGSDGRFELEFEDGDSEPLTDADADLMVAGGLFTYFFGHVAYQDVFGNDRETQFCWRQTADRFEEWGGRTHNYRT